MAKPSERAFPLHELPWRSIAEGAADGLFVSDAKLRIVWVNRRGCELLDRAAEQIIGHTISDFFWSAGDLEREPLRSGELGAGQMTLTQRAFRTQTGER